MVTPAAGRFTKRESPARPDVTSRDWDRDEPHPGSTALRRQDPDREPPSTCRSAHRECQVERRFAPIDDVAGGVVGLRGDRAGRVEAEAETGLDAEGNDQPGCERIESVVVDDRTAG